MIRIARLFNHIAIEHNNGVCGNGEPAGTSHNICLGAREQ